MRNEAKGATKRARAIYDNARTLLAEKNNLHLTPLQSVLQFFELHKATNAGQIYHQSLREILDLLPQCDWTVCHPDGWVAMDPEGRTKSTIVSPEMLIKEHIEPLLGPIDDTGEFLRQLAQMSAEQKDALVQQLKRSQTQDAELKAQGALDGRISNYQPGDNQYTERGDDNVITSARGTGLGNSAAYLASRIMKAGHHELLREVGPGKRFKSIRAAAIEAGVIKDVPTVRLTEPNKVVDQVLERMGPEWAAQLAAALTERLTAAD